MTKDFFKKLFVYLAIVFVFLMFVVLCNWFRLQTYKFENNLPTLIENKIYDIQLVDWEKAWQHAKSGKTVRLTAHNVKTPNNNPFTFFLVDGDKKYKIGMVSFFAKKPSNFMFNLSSTLIEMPVPPSNIILKTSIPVMSSSVEVELADD